MMDIIDSQVLVLNNSWQPIHLTTVREAFCDVMSDKAKFIDPDTFILYKIDEWICLPKVSVISDKKGNESLVTYKTIRTPNKEIRLPEVIILDNYDDVPDFELRLTAKNIALRDGFKCQYCNCRLNSEKITLDHIIPQSKGGKNSWENLVLSCFKCNTKKANRTPEQAGMKLLSVPKKPKWFPLTAKMGKNAPISWSKFVKNFEERPCMKIA